MQDRIRSKWKTEADTRNDVAFVPCATIKSDKVIVWTKAMGVYTGHEYVPKTETKFSEQAQLRFGNVFDNFVNLFNSIHARDSSIIQYSRDDRRKRKPVHLTLTIPDQNGLSDLEVKQHCLEPFIDNLTKHHDLKLWIWKAEAQLRGALHFHLVIDKYQEEPVIRELWYNRLKWVGCIDAKKTPLEQASRIVWLNNTPDLSLLKLELGGYYAATEDQEGNLVYKHDRTKRVRQIEGSAWGSCDRLKYKPMTVWNCEPEFLEDIPNMALEDFSIKEKWTPEELQSLKSGILSEEGKKNIENSKRSFGHCFLFKKLERMQEDGKEKKIVLSKPYDISLQETLNSYHWLQAAKTYGGFEGVRNYFTRADELMIAKNGMFSLLPSHRDDRVIFERYN